MIINGSENAISITNLNNSKMFFPFLILNILLFWKRMTIYKKKITLFIIIRNFKDFQQPDISLLSFKT